VFANGPDSKRPVVLMATTVASGAAYASLAILNRAGMTRDVDRATFFWLRDYHSTWLDVVGSVDDVLLRVAPTFAVAVALAVLLIRIGPRWVWIAPLFILVTGVIEFLTKHSLSRPITMSEILSAARELLGGHYHTAASFPSGHVARAFFLATIGAYALPRGLAILFYGVAVVTFVARMYTEAHKLSDVVAGAALGIFIASCALSVATFMDLRSRKSADPER
jgi:membrane-associated phospholipid phosphatase